MVLVVLVVLAVAAVWGCRILLGGSSVKMALAKPPSFAILEARSLTRSLQSTGNRGFQEGTDRQTDR